MILFCRINRILSASVLSISNTVSLGSFCAFDGELNRERKNMKRHVALNRFFMRALPELFWKILSCNTNVCLALIIDNAYLYICLTFIVDKFSTSNNLMVLLLTIVINKIYIVIRLAFILNKKDFCSHLFYPFDSLSVFHFRSSLISSKSSGL